MNQTLFSKKAFQSLLFGFLMLLCAQVSWGQTAVSYSAMTTVTCPATPVSTISTPPTGLTFSQLSRGSGVTCGVAGGSISGSGFNGTLAANITGSKWYTFSITSNSSVTFTLSSLSIVSRASNATGANVSVQYSIGGSTPTTVIGSYTPTTAAATYTITPATPISVGASQVLNIYIIPNSLTATGTTCRVENATSATVKTTSTAPTYSVTYNANSATSGSVPTDATAYTSGATVTVKANTGTLARTGYAFSGWNTAANGSGTDYAATGSATLTMGSANVTLYAKWTPTYTLTYTANANGTISGTTPQTVASGANGTAVTAVPNTGYHFVSWSDASTANPRTDSSVAANVNVSATFAINTYTLTYTAGANGSISGTTPQTVNYNTSGIAVTATPATGYHFVSWSDASTANPRTDSSVVANVSVSATFAINTYTLSYTANANGSITGTTPQTVNYNATGSAITATPATGYHFVSWSDGVLTASRTDSSVAADVTVSATFAINSYSVYYNGNTSDGGTAPTATSGNYGATVTLSNEGTLTKTGYNFNGWNTAADGSGTSYSAGDSYIIGTTDITLYAKWASAALTPQTITFGTLSDKVYSTTTFNLTATASSGLSVSYTSSNTNVATVSGNTVSLVGVGSTTITAFQAGNVTYDGATPVGQSLNVTPKELTIPDAATANKEYDRTNTAALTGTLSGIINSDDVTPSLSATFNTATVGTGKSVTSTSSLGGTKAGNYTLTQPTGLTANITAKALTVTGATVTSKSYTGTNTATLTGASLVGAIAPDVVNITGGGTFADVNVNSGIGVTTSFSLNGTDAGNYSITQPTGLTGTIITAPLTINITGLTANKVYDALLAATITGTPAYVGLQNGETFSVTGTPAGTFLTKGIGTAKPITVSGYTAPNANYSITQPTTLTGNITVATLTVTGATAANKVFDGTTTTTTSGGSFLGVLLTDSVNLTHGTANFASSAVGTGIAVTSTITATGTDGANYSVTQPSLTANITAAPVVLAGWQFGSPASTGSETTYNATTNNSNLSTLTLSRGAGITATALGRGFAANNFDANATKANAITNNEYFEFSINALSGYNYSLSTLNATLRRSGATAPNAYIWMYSSNGTTFNEIGTDISFTSTADGAVQTAISLSGISALQNAKSITFRLYAWGGTSTSATFSIARYAVNNTTNSLAISGNTFADITPPTLVADSSSNTVDNNNDITFTDDATWRTKITTVKIGTTVLTPSTDYVISSGTLQLKPSGGNVLLTTAGSKAVTVIATGYTNATVTQVINPGVPTTNSTATISAILAPSTTRTITCTALDQYSNYVSGYTFKYTATITNSDATTAETYTINGADYTSTTTQNVDWNGITPGVTTFTATLPTTIDGSDGISIQVKLADGTTTIGSPFAYHALPSQTITFNSLSNKTYGDVPYTISATGGASGNPIVFTSSDPLVATCSGTNGTTITVIGPGTCTIFANQAGNSGYNAAAETTQTLTVAQKALTISSATAQDKVYNGNNVATITGTLNGVISPDVVTLSLIGTFADINANTGIVVTSTSTLGGANAGKYTLTQPTGLTASITQVTTNTINSFFAITNKIIGQAPFTLAATSTSGLTVTYASSNTAVATISGNTVTIVGVGTTTITASQSGNGNYVAATPLTQELIVTPVPIAAWDFTGAGNYTTIAATTFSSNLVSTSNTNTITRGSTASSSTGTNSFRTTGFQNNGIATSNTDYFQVTLAPVSGQNISLSTINANFVGTNTFIDNSAASGGVGVTSQYAYSLNGTTFTLIGSPVTSTSLKPAEIDLSGVAALQNVPSGTTITLRYYASGQTTTGGWGFNSATAGTNGLSIGGSFAGTPTTTWDGSVWSNGSPTISKNAVIDAAYSTTDYGVFSANSLTVNSGYTITVNSGHTLTVTNEIINNGTFIVENNANIIQTNNVANTGSITVKRNTAMRRLDYTYWSSPVSNQNLLSFSPLTLATRFYTFDEPTNVFVAVASPSTTTFGTSESQIAGKGFMIRSPNTFLPAPAAAQTFNGIYTGVPNNGTYTTPVSNSGANHGYNLIGNPYPSPIDADKFLAANPGTLYFWTHAIIGSGANNYASYTAAGATAAAANGASCNGTIQTGQGFLILTTTNGNATFTNAMRVGNTAGQFFRTASKEKHRIWLNLNSATTALNQIMVGYMEDATQGADTSIDGSLLAYGSSSLSSRIENADYVIQGRALPFATDDTVPLGFNAAAAGEFTISIDHVDGLFLGSQDIYLRDNLFGTTFDIKSNPYTFTSASGAFNSRFEIVYTSSLLATHNPTFDANSVVVYKQEQELNINSGSTVMAKVRVFDVRGRLLLEKNNINATAVKLTDLKAAQQVVLVQITSDDNRIVTKKVVY